jgi:hypothetical protein
MTATHQENSVMNNLCFSMEKELIVENKSIEMNAGRNGPRNVLNPAHPKPRNALSSS